MDESQHLRMLAVFSMLPKRAQDLHHLHRMPLSYVLDLYNLRTMEGLDERLLTIVQQAYDPVKTDAVDRFKIDTEEMLWLMGAGVVPIGKVLGEAFTPSMVHAQLDPTLGAVNGQGGTIIYSFLVRLVDWLMGEPRIWSAVQGERGVKIWLLLVEAAG